VVSFGPAMQKLGDRPRSEPIVSRLCRTQAVRRLCPVLRLSERQCAPCERLPLAESQQLRRQLGWTALFDCRAGGSYRSGQRPLRTHRIRTLSPGATLRSRLPAQPPMCFIDGLLYHEADLSMGTHHTDGGAFSDHNFALAYLLGFYFAPRIRNQSGAPLQLWTKNRLAGARTDHRQARRRKADHDPLE